nr:immunoglobulin heavy chain junction region [Mus musculus]
HLRTLRSISVPEEGVRPTVV